MKVYRNKKTGREITVESELSGAWELAEETKAVKEAKPTPKK